MPTGTVGHCLIMVDRPAGKNSALEPAVRVVKAGPFLEVYLNDCFLGKVMKLTDAHCTTSMGDCSGRCIRLKQCIIVLTDDEEINIANEFVLDRDHKNSG